MTRVRHLLSVAHDPPALNRDSLRCPTAHITVALRMCDEIPAMARADELLKGGEAQRPNGVHVIELEAHFLAQQLVDGWSSRRIRVLKSDHRSMCADCLPSTFQHVELCSLDVNLDERWSETLSE